MCVMSLIDISSMEVIKFYSNLQTIYHEYKPHINSYHSINNQYNKIDEMFYT